MKFAPFLRSPYYDRMSRMMDRLDVDVISLAESRLGQDLIDANAACRCCNNAGQCESWLDGKAKTSNPFAFCPNGAAFDEHRRKAR